MIRMDFIFLISRSRFALDEMQIKLLRIYLFFTEMQEYIYIYILNFKISQFFDRSLYMTSNNSDFLLLRYRGTENRNIFNESELFSKSKRRAVASGLKI